MKNEEIYKIVTSEWCYEWDVNDWTIAIHNAMDLSRTEAKKELEQELKESREKAKLYEDRYRKCEKANDMLRLCLDTPQQHSVSENSKVKLQVTENRRRLHIGPFFTDLNEIDYRDLVAIFSIPPQPKQAVNEEWKEANEDRYYDLTDLSQEEKAEFLRQVGIGCSKALLKTFLSLGLKSHIHQMIKNDGVEYVMRFDTLESFNKQFPTTKGSEMSKEKIIFHQPINGHGDLDNYSRQAAEEISLLCGININEIVELISLNKFIYDPVNRNWSTKFVKSEEDKKYTTSELITRLAK